MKLPPSSELIVSYVVPRGAISPQGAISLPRPQPSNLGASASSIVSASR